MRGDEQIDSLSIEQSADEAPKVEDGARIFVTVGGQSAFGGRSPPDGGFLVNFLRKENWNNRGGER